MIIESKIRGGIVWEQYEWGGVDSYLSYLLNDWPEKSDHFIIFYNRHNKGSERLMTLLNSNVKFEFIEISSFFRNYQNQILKILQHIFTPLIFILNAFYYKKILCRHDVNVVIAQNGGYPGSYGNIAAIFGAYLAKKSARILVIHHAAIKPLPLHGFFRLVMERQLSKIVTTIITVSNITKETLRINTALMDTQECNIVTIGNGVPCSSIYKAEKLIHNKEIKICIIGRFESYKGHDVLMFALRLMLDNNYKNFKVDFIGGFSKNDYLRVKNLINMLELDKYINILGYVNEDVGKILVNYDLLVMATKTFEGFGLTILEAINVGTPVIASKVGISGDIFPEGSVNLVEPGNVIDMYNALSAFINIETRYNFNNIDRDMIMYKFGSIRMASLYRYQFLIDMAKSG